MENKATYSLDEIKEKCTYELQKVEADNDLTNYANEFLFSKIAELKESEGIHVYISNFYYVGMCKIGDMDSINLFNKYNWRRLVIVTIKCINENEFTFKYGLHFD